MTRKCIVPYCKSGYKGDKERVSLFHLPKNEKLNKKWIEAIPKTRIPLKSTHLVCEKHFLESEIVRHFEHRDAAGKIIAKVAFKCVRLVDGAVPSVFSSITYPTIKQEEMETDEEKPQVKTLRLTSQDPFDYSNERIISAESTDINCREPETSHNYKIYIGNGTYMNETMEQKSESERKLRDAFVKLLENPYSVEIPNDWFRSTNATDKKWVAFSTIDARIGVDGVQPMIRKSVLVTENGTVSISAHGKTVSSSNLSPSLPAVETVRDLTIVLSALSSMGICDGVTILRHVRSVRSSLVYRDNFGIWRHKRCPIVYLGKQCIRCRSLRRTFRDTSRRRILQSLASKRMRLDEQ